MLTKNQNVRRGNYRTLYTIEDVDKAYRLVREDSLSARQAAARFGVPVSTLKDRLNGKVHIDTVKSGPSPLFSLDEEAFLVNHIRKMGEIGYGYTRRETLNLATDYAIHLGYRERNSPLTYKWMYNFLNRQPQLKVLKPRKLEACRAKSCTKEAISRYFDELTKIMDKHDFRSRPQAIFNVDEKGLSTDVTPTKVVAGGHFKAQTVTSGKSKTVTMIAAVNAIGSSAPPYFVFPGKRMMEDLLSNATPGADGTVSDSGWSNTDIFSKYMKDHLVQFMPARSADSPVLVLYDGHKSHVSLDVIEWAIENHIILFVLPPHTSHLLQPLDVACYGPFETTWIQACHSFLRSNSGKAILRNEIGSIACKVHTTALTSANIIASFKKSGIFPLDAEVVNDLSILPSESFERPPPDRNNNSAEDDTMGRAKDFLQQRGGKVFKNVQTFKERKTLSKVIGGKPITDPDIVVKIVEHKNSQKASTSSKKRIEKTVSGGSSNREKRHRDTEQGTSQGRCKRRRTAKVDIPKENTDMSGGSYQYSESETEDTEVCCVCHKFSPDLSKTIELTIVSWGQYDVCGHWTHLKFCTTVTVLRRHSFFRCPCCQHGFEE